MSFGGRHPGMTRLAVTRIAKTLRAGELLELAGVNGVEKLFGGVNHMVDSEERASPCTLTVDESAENEPERPKTRGDCRDGLRPCPWVSCEHHLLIELGRPYKHGRSYPSRHPGLSLAVPGGRGRRAQLAPSSSEVLVEAWIDQAVELLWSMPETCSLDVAERGASAREVSELIGVYHGDSEVRRARESLQIAIQDDEIVNAQLMEIIE